MVANGEISSYGVSSNVEGCDWSVTGNPNAYESTSLSRLVQVAEDAQGETCCDNQSLIWFRQIRVVLTCCWLDSGGKQRCF
jgi:hypothetical protein